MAPSATLRTCLAPCSGLVHPAGSPSPEPGRGCSTVVGLRHSLAPHLFYIFPHENRDKMTCCTENTVLDSCKAWIAQVKASLLQYLHMS